MSGRIVVVGLGPAGPELVSDETRRRIGSCRVRYLRTDRHSAASLLEGAASFDAIYEECTTLEDVYAAIVDVLVAAASEHGEVLYAVPGSPAVAERTVRMLQDRADEGVVELEVLAALSFVDLAWVRLGVDPVHEGIRIVDGQRFAVEAAGERGPLLVAQCDSTSVLSEVKLAVDDPPIEPVTVLQRLGLPDEEVSVVAWDQLDRVVRADHLTSLYIPRLAAPIAGEVQRFVELARTLRRECPWDRQQTHASLVRHLIEEAYEVVDAISDYDPVTGEGSDDLEEELGDLLFQVVFHSVLATEEGRFTLADVARTVHEKLVARHPHVFAEVEVDGPEHVARNWEQIKKQEKGRESVMDGIPPSLPALLLASKLQRKAAQAGMTFPSLDDAFAKVAEELEEVRDEPDEHEVGDLLFASTGVALELGIDPEAALPRVRPAVPRPLQGGRAAGGSRGHRSAHRRPRSRGPLLGAGEVEDRYPPHFRGP